MSFARRTIPLVLAGAVLSLGGCAVKPLKLNRADGTYCHSAGRSYSPTLTCTMAEVPSIGVELEAKRFEATPSLLTVYVVRHRWADSRNAVPVSMDNTTLITTVPESLIRFRVKPGDHQLALTWNGRRSEKVVSGAAGEVRFVELAGSDWSWGTKYEWADGSPETSISKARASKLIADFQ